MTSFWTFMSYSFLKEKLCFWIWIPEKKSHVTYTEMHKIPKWFIFIPFCINKCFRRQGFWINARSKCQKLENRWGFDFFKMKLSNIFLFSYFFEAIECNHFFPIGEMSEEQQKRSIGIIFHKIGKIYNKRYLQAILIWELYPC